MTNLSKERLAELRERVLRCRGADNPLDIAVAIALFVPDKTYASVRQNAAGTKLVYTTRLGGEFTDWAGDYTGSAAQRRKAAALLSALAQDTP